MMIEVNSHLIEFNDVERGLSMISIKNIMGVFPSNIPASKGAMIQTHGTDFYAKESCSEIIGRIQDIQRIELLEAREL